MKHEIKVVAKEIDSVFDYSNRVSFGDNYLKQVYGDKFATEFINYFSDEWFGALGDVIIDIDVQDLISRAVRFAFASCNIEYIDSGNHETLE
jgi:hypothetical protein